MTDGVVNSEAYLERIAFCTDTRICFTCEDDLWTDGPQPASVLLWWPTSEVWIPVCRVCGADWSQEPNMPIKPFPKPQ